MSGLFGWRKAVLLAVPIAALAAPLGAQIGSELNISPKRVVFAGAQGSATVFVFNRGNSATTYRVDLIDRIMLPDGQIVTSDEAAKTPEGRVARARFKTAAKMIDFTPRRVTLGPGKTQTIRVRLLRPAALAAGEYRTTLTVSALPPESAGLTADQAVTTTTGEVSMRVFALFGVSIPLVVRQGPHPVFASISAAEVVGGKFRLVLGHTGAGSVYGDIEIRRGSAKGEVVGAIKGIGVYEEADSRPLAGDLYGKVKPGERLVMLFRDDDGEVGKIQASATTTAK